MSSQGLQFLPTFSWILVSKNICLVFLMMFLKILQSSTYFETLYFSSSPWYSSFHHNYEYFAILIIFEYLNQILSILLVNFYTICSRFFLLDMYSIFSTFDEFNESSKKFLFFFAVLDNCFWADYSSYFITIYIKTRNTWREKREKRRKE